MREAFALSGLGNYVEVPDAPELNPVEAMTVDVWLYPRAASYASPIIKKAGEGLNQLHGFALEYAASPSSGVMFWAYTAAGWQPSGPAAVPLNAWSHVAGVFDGSQVLLYVNGALRGSRRLAMPGPIVGSGNSLCIGADPSNPSRRLDALLDEASLYARALSSEEVHAVYTAGVEGKCPPTPNRPSVAVAGDDIVVEGEGPLTAVHLDASASFDPDGDPVVFDWFAPNGVDLDDPQSAAPTGLFPVGATLVTVTVTDGNGGMAVDDVLVTVEDRTPALLRCTTALAALWPPNHEMISVTVIVNVSDACSAPETLLVSATASSSEPDDFLGDGLYSGDVDGQDGYAVPVPVLVQYDEPRDSYLGSVLLRAERDGVETGRTYSLECVVVDPAGNRSVASCVVIVPHDRRRR